MALRIDKEWKWIDAPGRHRFGKGLYMQILHPDNRSWVFRFELNGRTRDMGLGSAGPADGKPERGSSLVTLDEATDRVLAARKLLRDGIDPIIQRKAERAANAVAKAKTITFQDAVRQYLNLHESKWRSAKHARQWTKTLQTYAYPKIGRLPVADIDVAAVLRVLDPIWRSKTETASRLRGRIERVLDWATVRGYRQGDNPARWKGFLAAALPARSQVAKVVHHAALPFVDVPTFMAELVEREGMAAKALAFTVLTAARTGEVTGAVWSEIDVKSKVWTIPAERMKAHRAHRVPLSKRALAILTALPREAEFVFIGARQGSGLSNMAMMTVLRRMERNDITTHGFRSSFRDWAAEHTAVPNHVVEMALAHSIGDKVEASYRRGDLLDQRRRLMETWATYCVGPQASRKRAHRPASASAS